MNEPDDKLLADPLETPELPAPEPAFPFLSTAEFIANTPREELNNMFAVPEIKPGETSAAGTKPAPDEPARSIWPDAPAAENVYDVLEQRARSSKKFLTAIIMTAVIATVIVAALYVWGGILRGTIVISPAPKLIIK